jgi:ADP-ribose pyrophosphatase YjhB (NUDIX family)
VEVLVAGDLLGVYSHPDRDFRFHAVTVVVGARVSTPFQPPKNPLEVADVGLFEREHLPEALSHQMGDMISSALQGKVVWE